jgi:uncharacterized membrane protein
VRIRERSFLVLEAAMPLSEYERQTLDEMEHELADGSGGHRPLRGRVVLRYAGGAVGLLLIIAGLRITGGVGVFVAVVGYGLVVAVTAAAVAAVRERRRRDRPETADE